MSGSISYQRSRFATDLPADRRYTASHCWLAEDAEGIWRVGVTQFATWLLGDLVEYDFSVTARSRVTVGQEIGCLEGLKSLTTIHCVAEGEFLESGSGISSDITLIDSAPYERGWLYRVRGTPAPDNVDVHGYIALLDEAVDQVVRGREEECAGECEG